MPKHGKNPFADVVTEVSKQLLDEGKLIDAGFVALRHIAIPKDASLVQVAEMRMAFFAGAQHLFGTIMTILDPGSEPTEADLRRMDLIDRELQQYLVEVSARFGSHGTKGRA